MPSRVTDARVQRISFVRRAATRDPRDPTQPRRVLLWKSEDAAPDAGRRVTLWKAGSNHNRDERIDPMLTLTDPEPLEKRAIGRPATKPPASSGLLTVAEIEERQGRYADLLAELEDDMTKMRKDSTLPPHVLHRHEEAHRGLAVAYQGLDAQRGTAERLAPMVKAADSPITLTDVALRKADPSLSPTESLAMAIRLNPDAYYAEGGIRRGGSGPAPAALSKAERERRVDEAAVERRADELVKSEGLRPTVAYATALAESGAYSRAA
jgi:hypothetical protein